MIILKDFEMGEKNWRLKLGIVLIFLSAPIFLSLLLIPFLNIENTVKISLTTIIIIIGEIVFWTGGLLVGKEMFSKYKSYLNPKNWIKKKAEKNE
ncbi:transporter suffix domain-containing protein [Bacteroidota bacterium]